MVYSLQQGAFQGPKPELLDGYNRDLEVPSLCAMYRAPWTRLVTGTDGSVPAETETNMILVFVLAALLQSPSSRGRDFIFKVDRYMRAQMGVNQFNGSILIAEDGKVLLSRGYGLTGAKSSASNASKTRFRVGSIAQQFTDLAILQLQEQSRLHVQDSVCTYIKNCPDDWKKVTLFDLMTNTSGIPAISTFADGRARSTAPSLSALVGQIKKEPLDFKASEKFDSTYSEEEVLDAVVEAASGEPYLRYLRKHIFAPAGMTDTGYDDRLRTLSKPEQLSLLFPSDVQRSSFYTAGGIYSTTMDLYLWCRSLATAKLVSRNSVKEMFTPLRDGYGFGWMVQEEVGRKLLTQGGLGTYSSSLLYYPDDDICVVVLSQSEATDGQKIGRDVAAILFGHHYEVPTQPKVIALDRTAYRAYVGRYSLASNFVLTVTTDDHGLLIRRDGGAEIELFPNSKTAFFLKGSDAKVAFVMGPNGRADQLVLQQGGRDIAAQRIN